MGLRVGVSGSRCARRNGAGESFAKVCAGKVRLFCVVSELVAVGSTGLMAIGLVETALDKLSRLPVGLGSSWRKSWLAVIDKA